MAGETKKEIRLRTAEEVAQAYEWVFNEQRLGTMDSKTADALNTTLKGVTYLRAKLRMDAAKLLLQAKIKKIDLPVNLLGDIVGLDDFKKPKQRKVRLRASEQADNDIPGPDDE